MTARFPGINEIRAVIDRAYSAFAHPRPAAPSTPMLHQISFRANWIWREGVCVDVIRPALEMGFPLWSKTVRLSVGEEKFARLNTLKNSARNWALKLSEMRRIRLFLNSEKSRFEMPCPITLLRPRFPYRFAQVPGMPGFGCAEPAGLKPNGTHCEAIAGVACGRPKQLGLMYWLGLPGLVSVSQPGPMRRPKGCPGSRISGRSLL
jgi:hypothetical protein